jgi:hypothetical protein
MRERRRLKMTNRFLSQGWTRMALSSAALLALSMVAVAQRSGAFRDQPGGWQILGEANVDGGIDHDSISVTNREGPFRAIQLRVENNTVNFQRVVVHYANGQSNAIRIRSRIAPGTATRAIDLPGERRIIDNVELWYSRANWGGRRPKVLLLGMR